MIASNIIGGVIRNPDVVILVDEKTGDEYTLTMTDEDVELTADVNDVRIGKTAALEGGVKEGEKNIPAYETEQGRWKILPGKPFEIPIFSDYCQYTRFQAVVCIFNTSAQDSVSISHASFDNETYAAGSNTKTGDVTVDLERQTISLGMVNDTDNSYVIRYFMYREVP